MATAKWRELIDKYEFLETSLHKASETLVVDMTALEVSMLIMIIHLIRKLLLVVLEEDKALKEVWIEYNDFVDVFLSDLAIELSDCTKIKK